MENRQSRADGIRSNRESEVSPSSCGSIAGTPDEDILAASARPLVSTNKHRLIHIRRFLTRVTHRKPTTPKHTAPGPSRIAIAGAGQPQRFARSRPTGPVTGGTHSKTSAWEYRKEPVVGPVQADRHPAASVLDAPIPPSRTAMPNRRIVENRTSLHTHISPSPYGSPTSDHPLDGRPPSVILEMASSAFH